MVMELSQQPEVISWQEKGWVNVRLNYRACLKFKQKDELEVGFGTVLLYRAGLGSIREIGKVFGRSGSDVARKVERAKEGIENIIDGRKTNGRKIKLTKELKSKIWSSINKEPLLTDEQLTKIVNEELPAGQEISSKTVERFLSESGIRIWRNGLRQEQGNRNRYRPKNQMMLSRYGGAFLSIGCLGQLKFWDIIGNLKTDTRGAYNYFKIGLTIYFLYLIGKRRLYDLDSVLHRDFAALIAKPGKHLLSSGAHKRLNEMAEDIDVDKFEQSSCESIIESGMVDSKVFYVDSHVSEVWRKENISMALHGIKRRKVKAINKHCIVNETGDIPLTRELTSGRRRLSQVLSGLVTKVKKYLSYFIIAFDKGGVSKKTFNACIEEEVGFVAWGPKWVQIRKEIEKIPNNRYRLKRKIEIKNKKGKKVKKIVERLAETKIEYPGIGKVRTVVVWFLNTNEKAWIYTNLPLSEYSTLKIREIIRYKQREENFFKNRKCFGAIDCFGGGKAKRLKIIKPTLKQITRQQKRFQREIQETKETLQQINSSYSSHLFPKYPYKKAKSLFEARLDRLEERLIKTEQKRIWVEGGKKPDWLVSPYELDLRKERILTQFQDWAYITKWQILKKLKSCYAKVLHQEGMKGKQLQSKLNSLDITNLWREVISLEGQLIWDHENKLLKVKLEKLRKPLLQKALQKYCYQLNLEKPIIYLRNNCQYQVLSCG